MDEFILGSDERRNIYKTLSEHKRLRFNEIADLTKIRSNKLSYQLNLMQERQFLVHENETYELSIEAQRLIPYFSQIFKKEVGVLPVILGIVRNNDSVLLIQRKKMPYKGYWGLIGGKQISGETIQETIEREVEEEAGVKAEFERYNAVVYERLREDGQFKNSFLFIITTLRTAETRVMEKEEGRVAWFDYKTLIAGKQADIIPSDVEFLRKYSDRTITIDDVIIDEHKETLQLETPTVKP